MGSINVTKGLFRVWVVVSLCWIIFWAWHKPYKFTVVDIDAYMFLFGFPVGLLLLGYGVLWAVRGFKE